jgi:hypothetical protein
MTRIQQETDQSETERMAIATPPSPRQAKPVKPHRRPERDAPGSSTNTPETGEPEPAKAPADRQTKKAALVALLKNPGGASLSALMAATGWQAHSVRAALTGLRKEGHAITRQKNNGGDTRYRLDGEV